MWVAFTRVKQCVVVLLITLIGVAVYSVLNKYSKPKISKTIKDVNSSSRSLNNKYNKLKKEHNLNSKTVHIAENKNDKTGQNSVRNNANVHPSYDKLLQLTRENREKSKEILDIMGQPRIKFDPSYKNPCFMGDKKNSPFNDGQLHCLPYFYVIGVKKSGTTDLFHRISAHPEFKGPGFKEAQWFSRIRSGIGQRKLNSGQVFKKPLRNGIDNRSMKYYISLFDAAATKIQSSFSKNVKGAIYHNSVTGEGTPANLHMHTSWDLMPGNAGLVEPRYTNFHYIKHMNPNVKIIIIFRDPVTRLFSDFKHEHKGGHISAGKFSEKFHDAALVLTQTYKTCFRQFSMRRCIYNDTLLQKEEVSLKASFRAGFYAFFMEELLSVFKRDQILAVHMTRYVKNARETLKNTFKFLDMSPLSGQELTRIVNLTVSNRARNRAEMKQKTKDMLYKFYKPYNKQMAELMKDNAYLFPQS